MWKRMVAALALPAILLATAMAADVKLEGIKCLVAGNQPAKSANASEYKGGKVFFCCGNCKKAFDGDNKKFAAKANHQLVATSQAKQAKCPLTGGPCKEDKFVEVAGAKVYFCCDNCNTPKATFFPLEPGAAPLPPRALPSTTPERAVLLDPGVEDPEPHITWRWMGPKHGYVPVGVTARGKQTIRAVALDQRDTLKLLRARYYALHVAPVIDRHRKAKARGDATAMLEAQQDAEHLADASAELAGMARFVLRRAGIL